MSDLRRFLSSRLRLTRATEDMYIVDANGAWRRRYKPPRSKKQRRVLRKALAAVGVPT
jgi:hypothetical protein